MCRMCEAIYANINLTRTNKMYENKKYLNLTMNRSILTFKFAILQIIKNARALYQGTFRIFLIEQSKRSQILSLIKIVTKLLKNLR